MQEEAAIELQDKTVNMHSMCRNLRHLQVKCNLTQPTYLQMNGAQSCKIDLDCTLRLLNSLQKKRTVLRPKPQTSFQRWERKESSGKKIPLGKAKKSIFPSSWGGRFLAGWNRKIAKENARTSLVERRRRERRFCGEEIALPDILECVVQGLWTRS